MVLEINFKNSKLDVEILINNRNSEIRYIYMDTYENRCNYLSEYAPDHSHVFNHNEIFVSSTPTTSTYNISAAQLDTPNGITGLYIMTILYDSGKIERRIVYDLNELYCVRMKYITPICESCHDKAQYRALVVLMFRETLLRNAIAFNLIDDALSYYTDIFRPFCNNHTVQSCISGMCGIGGSCKTC